MAGQRIAFAPPADRRARDVEVRAEQLDGAVLESLAPAPADAFVDEPGVPSQRQRHARDRVIHPRAPKRERDAGLAQGAMAAADQGKHRTRLCEGADPDHPVEPRDMVFRAKVGAESAAEIALFGAAHRRAMPMRAHQFSGPPALARALEHSGEPHRRPGRQGRIGFEPAAHRRIPEIGGHRRFGGAAQVALMRPMGVAGDESRALCEGDGAVRVLQRRPPHQLAHRRAVGAQCRPFGAAVISCAHQCVDTLERRRRGDGDAGRPGPCRARGRRRTQQRGERRRKGFLAGARGAD